MECTAILVKQILSTDVKVSFTEDCLGTLVHAPNLTITADFYYYY